ncbi:MAG: DUF6514 family protein [Defluviitaleaceae bacterium]|nr:DUF6514 family protein [Defluviitaleaceae bacterium]
MTIEQKVNTAVVYNVVFQEVIKECGEPARTYGLQALVNGEVAQQVLDISVNSVFVHNLAKKFTEQQLSPKQLLEVVEEFIDVEEVSVNV